MKSNRWIGAIAGAVLCALPNGVSMCEEQGTRRSRTSLTSLYETPPITAASPALSSFKKTMTTIFWVGEGATPESGYIHNRASYWDANWLRSYGGVDDPERRKGYFPAAFTPKQNPFYVALPFADTDGDGVLKPIAKKIPGFGESKGPLTRNRWVEVRYKGRSCFGQWQDVGPSGEDDFDWVFGNAKKPRNQFGLKAGLDISPALAQCIGLEDSDIAEWRFAEEHRVPDGPWRLIVTR